MSVAFCIKKPPQISILSLRKFIDVACNKREAWKLISCSNQNSVLWGS